jgi:hypothetical protein
MKLSENNWIGKTINEAQEYSKNTGFTTRIIQLDGDSIMLTCDYNPSRVGLHIVDGIVVAVSFG